VQLSSPRAAIAEAFLMHHCHSIIQANDEHIIVNVIRYGEVEQLNFMAIVACKLAVVTAVQQNPAPTTHPSEPHSAHVPVTQLY
jgi:hypothetical protein